MGYVRPVNRPELNGIIAVNTWICVKRGNIPESHRKRGHKAHISRMATLSRTDPERFQRLFNNLPPGKRAAITRRLKNE